MISAYSYMFVFHVYMYINKNVCKLRKRHTEKNLRETKREREKERGA